MKKPHQSLNFPSMTRRSAMSGLALGGAGLMAAPLASQAKSDDFEWTLDLDTAEDNCLAVIKMQADTSGKDAMSGFPGQVWGWVPDEGNYHLLDTYGVGVSHVEFDEKMNGWKFYHRECQLYLDKDTGEVAESFLNPVTNKRQEVMHVFNDHVSRFYPLSGGRFGFPWEYEVFGNTITFRISVFRVEENPLTPAEYPLHSEGEVYQTGELWGIMGDLREIMDPEVTSASSTTSWVRVAGWIPFMEMGDRPGQVVFHSHAYKMKEGAAQLPPKVLAYLEKNAPEYLVSPTEWTTPGQRVTVFNHSKKVIDERRPNLKEGETPFGWKGE
ncbi:MAG: DUF1838 family protein [Gammaproteobacteria bacterium]